MKKIMLLLPGLLVAFAAFAVPIQQDTLELRLGGNMDFDNPNGRVGFLIETGLGYFVLNNIEVGGLATWGHDGSEFGYGLGGFSEFNLDLDIFMMPYAGMKIQYFFGDVYARNFINVGFNGGIKFFLSETVAVYSELFYDLASEDAYINDGQAENYDVGLKLGVRAYF